MNIIKEYRRRVVMHESKNVFQEMKDIKDFDREMFVVFHLDSRNRVICREIAHIGTLNACLVHPREVFKNAIVNGADSIILSHNHPSGDPTPSDNDRKITETLREAGKILNIPLLDHVIVGKKEYISMEEVRE